MQFYRHKLIADIRWSSPIVRECHHGATPSALWWCSPLIGHFADTHVNVGLVAGGSAAFGAWQLYDQVSF